MTKPDEEGKALQELQGIRRALEHLGFNEAVTRGVEEQGIGERVVSALDRIADALETLVARGVDE